MLVGAVSAGAGIGLVAQGRFEAYVLLYLFAGAAYSFLGLLIVARQPGNRVAWLLFTVASWVAVTGLTELLGGNELVPESVTKWDVLVIVWGNVGYFVGLLLPLLLFFYVFPTGRFLTRRWAWAGWVVAVISPLALFSQLFAVEVGPDGADWTVVNPFGFLEGTSLDEGVLGAVFGIGFVAVGLGAIPAIIARYRRSEAVVRTQVKWVAYATVLTVGSLVLNTAFAGAMPEWVDSILFIILLMAVPVSVTVAITRYQLYEIDRIISRTLSYTVVVAILGAGYVGSVALVTAVLPSQDSLAVAGSTLAVAALFNPVRRRIQNAVDRRFNRSGYQAQTVSDQFSSLLSEQLTPTEIAGAWGQMVNDTLQPEAAGIWIRSADGDNQLDSTTR